MLSIRSWMGDTLRNATLGGGRRFARLLPVLLLFLLVPLAPSTARCELPYPRLMTTLWNGPEPKDFGPASRFDAVEFFWTDIVGTPGYTDSVLAMKARNPDLKVIAVGWGDVHCTNWEGREVLMWRWSEQMAANDSLWYLRDLDGDYFKTQNTASCAEGFMNWTQVDMAEAFAQFLYDELLLAHPGVFDGIHFDGPGSSIWWIHSRLWTAGGIDSIDSNRDGLADTRDSLEFWWRRGVNAFFQRMRTLAGDDYGFIMNGSVSSESFPIMNGRFHEGFPGPVGGQSPDWYRSMFDPLLGYLVEPALYSATPWQMIPLQGLSLYPYDCDPNRLATTETPYNTPCCMTPLRLTVASALLGDGYACFTGWARKSTGGDAVNYHTTWWFSLYDTLRVNLGVPLGAAYDSVTSIPTQKHYKRQFTNGYVKLAHTTGSTTAIPTFDLRPKAVFRESPTAAPWVIGDQKTLRFRGWDPLTGTSLLKARLLLSRDGGTTYPETLVVVNATDSLATVGVSGAAAANCRLRVEARDYGGLKGWSDSEPFTINASSAAAGFAEISLGSLPAGQSAQASIHALITSAPSGGIAELGLLRPSTLSIWAPGIVTVNGGAFVGSTISLGDSIRVVPALPWGAGDLVRVRLTIQATTQANAAGSAVGVVFVPSAAPSQRVAALPGDADGTPGNGESLTLAVVPGPMVRLGVLPGGTTVVADGLRNFVAGGRDAYDNTIAVTSTWSVLGGIGSLVTGGLFHAEVAGVGAVTAAALGFADTAEVTVVPGPAVRVEVTPESLTFLLDEEAQFAAAIYDALGNQAAGSLTWSVTGPATLNGPGRLYGAATGTGTIIATSGALADSSLYRVKRHSEPGEASDVAPLLAAPIEGLAVWPSPIRPGAATRIAFAVPPAAGAAARDVALDLFDAQGRLVATLARLAAPGAGGTVSLAWEARGDDGRALPSGVYILRAAAPSLGFRVERKIVVLR